MIRVLLSLLLIVGAASVAQAGMPAAPRAGTAAHALAEPLLRVDWQDPLLLPSGFRNHCSVERWTGRPYCANHCGSGYEFYFCSQASFGCCKVDYGYCDWHGHLRCRP
jgi:hypothetical protein